MIETGEVGVSPQMPPEIAAAIIAVKKGIAQLGFDERNEHARYSYASVDKFYTAVRPLESEAGLSVMLDETAFDVREGAPNKQGDRASWAFLTYDVWLVSAGGVMWGPARRHWAGPVTGPQTFGAAESYVRKAFMRGLYMVPTGEKDGDETAPRDDAPVTKGVTRAAAPRPTNAINTARLFNPATSGSAGSSTGNGAQLDWIPKFLARKSYEIDAQKAGGWSAFERLYCAIADAADDFDQITKLDDDNKQQCLEFSRVVRPAVYDRFREHVKANALRLAPTPFVEESDAPSILDQMRMERRQSQGGDV
jgi:hypothetical protein